MNRRETFWYVLLWASFVAAIVSLMTTGLGLQRYLSFLLAWPLALAVQAGLFGLAWLIAVGRRRLRPLVIVLYVATMPFSVVFSYVMLQSEFTATTKPLEARRALDDELRAGAAEVASTLSAGISAGDELALRLGSWLEMERRAGWTMSTCDGEEHCYLEGVCRRVGRRIDSWERSRGQSYRQGPGEALIYGLLASEIAEITRIGAGLGEYRDGWTADGRELFADGLDNRERLRRYDAALTGFPQSDLEAVLCRAAGPPPPPAYGSFARDSADGDETPVYAFQDLIAIFQPGHDFGRSDYPTVFAFGLAAFIDLFVLLVAIGAALLPEASIESGAYPVLRLVPPEWSEALRRDITEWIDGSLLHADLGHERRHEFLSRLVDSLRFERSGKAVLVPEDGAQSRFGFLMARAQAATPTGMRGGESETTGFVLEEWVYPALTRYLAPEPSAG